MPRLNVRSGAHAGLARTTGSIEASSHAASCLASATKVARRPRPAIDSSRASVRAGPGAATIGATTCQAASSSVGANCGYAVTSSGTPTRSGDRACSMASTHSSATASGRSRKNRSALARARGTGASSTARAARTTTAASAGPSRDGSRITQSPRSRSAGRVRGGACPRRPSSTTSNSSAGSGTAAPSRPCGSVITGWPAHAHGTSGSVAGSKSAARQAWALVSTHCVHRHR